MADRPRHRLSTIPKRQARISGLVATARAKASRPGPAGGAVAGQDRHAQDVGRRHHHRHRQGDERHALGGYHRWRKRQGDVGIPAHHALQDAGIGGAVEAQAGPGPRCQCRHHQLGGKKDRGHARHGQSGQLCAGELTHQQGWKEDVVHEPVDRRPGGLGHEAAGAQGVAQADQDRHWGQCFDHVIVAISRPLCAQPCRLRHAAAETRGQQPCRSDDGARCERLPSGGGRANSCALISRCPTRGLPRGDQAADKAGRPPPWPACRCDWVGYR